MFSAWPGLSGIFASKVTSNPLFRTEMCRLSWELGAVAKHRCHQKQYLPTQPGAGGNAKYYTAFQGPLQLLDLELGGGFKYFLFSPLFGEDSHFD